MGIDSTFPRAHFERGFAHRQRRSPQVGLSSAIASASTTPEATQATAAPSVMLGSNMSSSSFKGMAVIIGGLVAIVLGQCGSTNSKLGERLIEKKPSRSGRL